MGLLDVLSSFLGNANTDGQPQHQAVLTAVMEFVNSQPGGLNGILQRFQEHGAGDVVQSWIGSGPNQPVSPDTLQNALGSDSLNALASKVGIPADQASSLLAQVLPHVVNQATPNGEVPPSGQIDVASVLGSLTQAGGLQSIVEGFLGKKEN